MARSPIILVVDDNTWMQRIVAKIVSSYGWEPIIAHDGYEGVALALEHLPDLVILDLIMPNLTGMQVLRLLKRLAPTQHIPVLILSVATEVELLMEAMNNGAAGFIRKPFTRSTIYEKVSGVLQDRLVTDLGSSTESSISSAPALAEQPSPPSPSPLDRYRQTPSARDEEELRRLLDSI